jgi:hypothetical protein
MVIDQRNNGATVNNTTASLYTLDRWAIYGTSASKFRVAQSGITTLPGFSNAIQIYSLAATTVSSSDIYFLSQTIEGYNTADLSWGTANAKSITVSFWVYSSLTGTFSGYIKGGGTYTYPYTYTISSANTWQQVSVTIPGQTSGTWSTTNTSSIYVGFSLGTGSTYTATPSTWTYGDYYGATGQTQFVSTNAATMYITGVQLEVGTQATSFDYRPYGTELALCQRYYAKLGATYSNYAAFGAGTVVTTTQADIFVKYPVTMRGAATATVSGGKINAGTSSNPISSISSSYSGTDSIYITFATSAGGMTVAQGALVCANNNAPDFLAFSAEL